MDEWHEETIWKTVDHKSEEQGRLEEIYQELKVMVQEREWKLMQNIAEKKFKSFPYI